MYKNKMFFSSFNIMFGLLKNRHYVYFHLKSLEIIFFKVILNIHFILCFAKYYFLGEYYLSKYNDSIFKNLYILTENKRKKNHSKIEGLSRWNIDTRYKLEKNRQLPKTASLTLYNFKTKDRRQTSRFLSYIICFCITVLRNSVSRISIFRRRRKINITHRRTEGKNRMKKYFEIVHFEYMQRENEWKKSQHAPLIVHMCNTVAVCLCMYN
jgi:hypothetical protein